VRRGDACVTEGGCHDDLCYVISQVKAAKLTFALSCRKRSRVDSYHEKAVVCTGGGGGGERLGMELESHERIGPGSMVPCGDGP
jgi:hypothetical protein